MRVFKPHPSVRQLTSCRPRTCLLAAVVAKAKAKAKAKPQQDAAAEEDALLVPLQPELPRVSY